MAEPAPKAPKKKSRGGKLYKNYEKKGDSVSRKNKFCPKCGQGFIMAKHQNRTNCGRCGYTEFVSSK